MQDFMNLIMLVCAIVASLAFGVLAAHALCRTAFVLLRLHAVSVANDRLEKAASLSQTLLPG